MLRFLGRGSAFSAENNSAFFIKDNELVLIDCSMSSFNKIKAMNLTGIKEIFVLVTHTHSDHIGGIAMLIDYEYFIGHIPVTVVAPSVQLKEDISFYLSHLDGCEKSWFSLITVNELNRDWFKEAILTSHAPQLEGRCFGYNLFLEGKNIVYTGDTNTLSPFLPYLTDGSILYQEASAHRSLVHMYIEDLLPELYELLSRDIKIYLMHLDNEDYILEKIKNTTIELAPLYKETTMENNILNDIFDLSDKLYKLTCSNEENDHTSIFKYVTELGKTLVGADRASFWKWDKRRHELWTTSATGVEKIVIPDTTGLVGRAIMNQKVLITNDPYNHPDFNSSVDKKTGYVTKSVLVLPVADVNGDYIGAFQLINKLDGNGFDEVEDTRKLSLPALICGLALESESFLEESHHDKLTKLKNRLGFYNDFAHKFNKYFEPDAEAPLSMFICDLDKFKLVNDTYGHNAGDQVLEHCAKLLMGACTETDSVYRWGGEEFIMIMENTTLEECVKKAEALRITVENSEFPADGVMIHKTLSLGCHKFDKSLSIEENISLADANLYTAKETGRNKVVY